MSVWKRVLEVVALGSGRVTGVVEDKAAEVVAGSVADHNDA